MATFQITLSDIVAEEAALAGLLESGNIESLLRDQLAIARIDRLKAVRGRLAEQTVPPMTSAEVEAEIAAFRSEQRRAAGS